MSNTLTAADTYGHGYGDGYGYGWGSGYGYGYGYGNGIGYTDGGGEGGNINYGDGDKLLGMGLDLPVMAKATLCGAGRKFQKEGGNVCG